MGRCVIIIECPGTTDERLQEFVHDELSELLGRLFGEHSVGSEVDIREPDVPSDLRDPDEPYEQFKLKEG